MAFVVKTLASGLFITAGTASIYTPNTGYSAIIDNIRVMNTGAATNALSLLVYPSAGGNYAITKRSQTLAVGSLLLIPDQLTLGNGDQVVISASVANTTYSYIINGVERF